MKTNFLPIMGTGAMKRCFARRFPATIWSLVMASVILSGKVCFGQIDPYHRNLLHLGYDQPMTTDRREFTPITITTIPKLLERTSRCDWPSPPPTSTEKSASANSSRRPLTWASASMAVLMAIIATKSGRATIAAKKVSTGMAAARHSASISCSIRACSSR